MTQYSGKVIRKTPVTPTQASASGVWNLTEQAAAIRNNTWPVAGVPDPISRSVRFRSSASAYFNRTPAIAGNQRTWTWSGWVKRGSLGSNQVLLSAGTSGSSTNLVLLQFNSSDAFQFYVDTGAASYQIVTTQVFRDPGAWYHIVVVLDTPQATSSNRMKLYVNGSQVTAFSTASYTPQNNTYGVNAVLAHNLGRYVFDSTRYFDGYIAEMYLIDGTALTPSSFGTTDPLTGAWIPMQYTGSYGTNGFYVNFQDNTSTTTLGLDYSGNANNWTANNISLTAGSTYDSMLDVPTPWIGYSATTDTSAVTRGNYCVMNPLDSRNITNTFTLNGNLGVTNPSTGTNDLMRATFMIPSGKWYWEATLTSGSSYWGACIIRENSALAYTSLNSGDAYAYSNNGTKNNGQTSTSYGNTYAAGDVVMVAFDSASGKIWFGKNGTWQASGDPVAATNEAFSGISGNYFPGVLINTSVVNFNFGQRPLAYAPPTGFKTLCVTNLPTPTILNGASYMAATTYTGNNSTNVISNSVNGVSMQPDFVWIKSRSSAFDHALIDSIRGVTKWLASNSTAAEATSGAGQDFVSFNSNGFTLGPANTAYVNNNSLTFVAWQWKANGTPAVTNTNGSITSTVSANTTAGFSVVTWAGNSTSGATIGHGLGVAPKLIITKSRTNPSSWVVGIGNISGFSVNDYLSLNSTNGKLSSSTFYQAYGASTFTVGVSAADEMNKTGNNYVAYCFSAVAGYSAFGSYTGNGSADGPFVFLGFRPRWVMFKKTNATSNWSILDTARDDFNVADNPLLPNTSGAETTSTSTSGAFADILSNGFKLRGNSGDINDSGATYIYAAFAENPFKYSNAR